MRQLAFLVPFFLSFQTSAQVTDHTEKIIECLKSIKNRYSAGVSIQSCYTERSAEREIECVTKLMSPLPDTSVCNSTIKDNKTTVKNVRGVVVPTNSFGGTWACNSIENLDERADCLKWAQDKAFPPNNPCQSLHNKKYIRSCLETVVGSCMDFQAMFFCSSVRTVDVPPTKIAQTLQSTHSNRSHRPRTFNPNAIADENRRSPSLPVSRGVVLLTNGPCNSDSDCVIRDDDCGGVALNKEQVAQWKPQSYCGEKHAPASLNHKAVCSANKTCSMELISIDQTEVLKKVTMTIDVKSKKVSRLKQFNLEVTISNEADKSYVVNVFKSMRFTNQNVSHMAMAALASFNTQIPQGVVFDEIKPRSGKTFSFPVVIRKETPMGALKFAVELNETPVVRSNDLILEVD